MNERIKFRIWCKSSNRFELDDKMCFFIMGNLCNSEESNNENYVIQQYTGLKDKNGKEIFEGDILQYRDGSHQSPYYDKVIVEWISENDGYDYSGWKLTDSFLQGGLCEIIGNIFENPELLK